MDTAIQREHETYRVIVLSPDARDILLVPNCERFAPPSVEIPRWQRVAENLTAAVRTDWGEEIVCLFELNDLSEMPLAGVHYQAARHWCTVGAPKILTRWVSVGSLSKEALADLSDYLAIQQSIAQCAASGKTSPAGPFTTLGWIEELRGWIEEVIAPLGFRLNGGFRQLNASPTFSLIRFDTDGPALWFKAVGEPNEREFPITCVLSRLFPGYVASVLGTRAEWHGWLTREVVGTLLSDVQEKALWEKAAAALAELQIHSIDHGVPILAAGVRDLGANALSKTVGPFIETMTQLMERQIKTQPAPLGRAELSFLRNRIAAALDALESLGIPETLGHFDLNPGNIVASHDRCGFLDWAEAYMGNPFFTFQYLLEHLRRTIDVNSALESSLISSYSKRWERMIGHIAIDEALSIAPLLAVFAYAAGNEVWCNKERIQDLVTAGYLRSLTRRMYREANALSERRSLCLH